MLAEEFRPLEAALAHRYRFVSELGRGAWGIVYLAEDVANDRRVAIKILQLEVEVPRARGRFLREIDILKHLEHDNILPILDSGEHEGLLYYVMPLVSGETLQQRLRRERQLPIREALRIAREVALALGHAHRVGVIHRDVKPANILLDGTRVWVADFGIARAIRLSGPQEWLSSANLQIGTPEYMSVEQASGDPVMDGRSDLYSLGCVLYEMLAGSPPFMGSTSAAVMSRHAFDPVPALRTVRPSVPPAIEELTLRALAKVPADRFASAEEMVAAIDSAQANPDATSSTWPTTRAGAPAWRWRRYVAGAAAVVILGVGWFVAQRSRHADGEGTRPTSLAARRAYQSGMREVRAGDLRAASVHFARAAREDADFAPAALWAVQLDAIADPMSESATWPARARGLERVNRTLRGRDSLLALAFTSIARGETPAALAALDRLRAIDSTDATGWIVRGIALSRDSVVIRDRGSPSGWRFRSSYTSAYRAFMRAVRLDPRTQRAVPISQLASLLHYRPATIRVGRAEPPDSGWFYALPSMDGDSVVLIPVPAAEFSGGAVPATVAQAVAANQRQLLVDLGEWVRRDSSSSDAFRILSELLESRGDLSGRDAFSSAERALERAVSLETNPEKNLELRIAQLRLTLKLERFSDARRAALAILSDAPRVGGRRPLSLAGVAALIGDVERAAEYEFDASRLPRSSSPAASEPAPLARAYSRFHAAATAGPCSPRVEQLFDSLLATIEQVSPPSERTRAINSLASTSAVFGLPCIAPGRVARIATGSTALHRMIRALARDDAAELKREAMTLHRERSGARPSDVTPDYAFVEAWLILQARDTAGAIARLDGQVLSFAALTPRLLDRTSTAGAVGRAMLLRSRLATREPALAAKWATAAEALLGTHTPAGRGLLP